MNFTTASAIETVTWAMRLSDYPRSQNRALINSLANGAPPYNDDEAERNRKVINVNDLTLTRILHDARTQIYRAFNTSTQFFRAITDGGAIDKRMERNAIVTNRVNRIMRRSNRYYECQRSKFANVVLHGIGPSNWQDQDHWCPLDLEISDVLIPGDTRITMEGLPFFAVWRGYTATELRRLTRMARLHPDRNPGWNIPMVDRAIEWADRETAKLWGGATWADYWVPEKMGERLKADAGIYASDRAATVSCWDFYFWDDYRGREGWRRRIIFDAFGGTGAWDGPQGYGVSKTMPDKNLIGDGPKGSAESQKSDFLFNSGNRVVADDWRKIMHFQFADLSAIAPFKYHTLRGLGFMLYAPCHLQNRGNCSFWEMVFEQLMNYMRVNSMDEAERALKVELINRGIIDESVHFLRQDERWQPNAQLIELGLGHFRRIIQENSSGFVQDRDVGTDKTEKTRFQYMAELQSMQALISIALQHAYRYQIDEYREIFRRLMKKDSADKDAVEFRAHCLSKGIPETLLTPSAWDIQPEKIMGGGNQMLELAAAQQLMQWRAAYAPDAQQRILKKATLAVITDPEETELLVPSEPAVSATRHDAAVAYGSLAAGAIIPKWPASANLLETAEVLIGELGANVQNALKMGGMVSMDKFMGFQNVQVHIANLLGLLTQDQSIKDRVKQLAQLSGKLANQIKAFGQRIAQRMKAGGEAGGDGKAAEAQAKVQSMMMQAKVKADNTRESHAQRTAQRQVQFELEQAREDQRLQRELQRDVARSGAEAASRDITTASQVRMNRMRSLAQAQDEEE